MTSTLLLPLLLLLLHFLLLSVVSVDDYNASAASPTIFRSVCGKTQTPDPQSFDVHFVDAMEKVYKNITKYGFATSRSESNLTVYGLGQCFNYLTPVNCQLCYAKSRVKLPHCLPATTARIYLDGCFLEYADRNVYADSVDSADTFDCANTTVGNSSLAKFLVLTSLLLGNLTASAYLKNDYYELGSIGVSVLPQLRVYAMAQCWKSLNASGCRECLEKGRESLIERCLPVSSAGGEAMNAGCFVRYSTEPFYLQAASGGSSSRSSSDRRRLIVGLSTVVAVLAVIGIVILWRRWRKSDSEDDDDGSGMIIRSIIKSDLSFRYDVLCDATGNFSLNKKLGQGGYGSVYKGILPDGREVAVKRLFVNTRQWVDQFFNEVILINQVQHQNLVKLLGCSIDGPESLLVYEFLCNTSLDHYLFDPLKKAALVWERRFEIITGSAKGLAYLHNASAVRIIHRDIKASNILLDERFRPKISDFGLARSFAEDQSHLSTGLAGTFGYMAPEYIVHGQLTEKADIYSYGIVVLEIITGRKNQNSISSSADGQSLMQLIWHHYKSDTLITMLDSELKGKCSEEEAMNVFRVGLLCVQASPGLRPPMWKVVEMLTRWSTKEDMPIPAEPPFMNIKGAGSSKNSGSIDESTSETSCLRSSSIKSPDSGQISLNLHLSDRNFQARCIDWSSCYRWH